MYMSNAIYKYARDQTVAFHGAQMSDITNNITFQTL